MSPIFALVFIAVVIIIFIWYKTPKEKAVLPEGYKNILAEHVSFYRSLDEAGRTRFEEKIQAFLGYIRIHGVNTEITDLDKLLISSSAVIPIFGFPEWKYYNLRDILVYPGSFNEEDFKTNGKADIMGMVGSGTMQQMMILSKPALYHGFDNISDKENTGIHEFVHLLDKEDGDVDGLPEALLDKKFTLPWLNLMADGIAEIKKGSSDINIYGVKNKAEFFAVAAEYFFEQPELFKKNHADLYTIMTQIFNTAPTEK